MELMPINEMVVDEDRHVIDMFDKDNKQSVRNICPVQIRNKIINNALRMKSVAEYLDMDEIALRKVVKIDPQLNRIRLAFWNEYYRAVDAKRDMRTGQIIGGICTAEKFHKLLCNDAKAAWILTPPADTVVALQETLSYGLDRVREILSLPLYKTESVKVGRDEFEDREVVDEKVANLMLKCVAMVDLRLHGSYVQVQKVEQKTININKNMNSTNDMRTVSNDLGQIGSVDERLKELRKEVDKDQKKLAAPITVEEAVIINRNGIKAAELSSKDYIIDIDIEDL